MKYTFCCKIEEVDGRYLLTFPDIGWGATDGATVDEALGNAEDCLEAIIAGLVHGDKVIPYPSFVSDNPITVSVSPDDVVSVEL